MVNHKECSDNVASVEEFLEALDNFRYAQSLSVEHKNYVNQVKALQAQTFFKELRREVIATIDAAEKEANQYLKLMETVFESSMNSMCSQSNIKFENGQYQTAGELNKAISSQVLSLISGSDQQELFTRSLKENRGRIGELRRHHQEAIGMLLNSIKSSLSALTYHRSKSFSNQLVEQSQVFGAKSSRELVREKYRQVLYNSNNQDYRSCSLCYERYSTKNPVMQYSQCSHATLPRLREASHTNFMWNLRSLLWPFRFPITKELWFVSIIVMIYVSLMLSTRRV